MEILLLSFYYYYFGSVRTPDVYTEPPVAVEETMIPENIDEPETTYSEEEMSGNVLEFYHGRECPHCQAEEKWLEETFIPAHPDFKILRYEVWHSSENNQKMQDRAAELGVPATGVPYNVLNGTVITGFSPDKIMAAAEEPFEENEEEAISTPSEKETRAMHNEDNPKVLVHTSEGDILLEIYEQEVPTMAQNFLDLAEAGKYDGTIFHRVIPGFMIQGGDYENHNGTGGDSAQGGFLPDEFNDTFTHLPGTLSMANRGPNTNGSQFFIMDGDADWLDGKHAIFGNVLEGLDTVSTIINSPTEAGDRPSGDIKILSLEILRD